MTQNLDPIVRQKDLVNVVGLSRSTIYRLERQGMFPPSIKLGPRAKGWRLSDLQKWIADGGNTVAAE